MTTKNNIKTLTDQALRKPRKTPTIDDYKHVFSRKGKDTQEQMAAYLDLSVTTIRRMVALELKGSKEAAAKFGYSLPEKVESEETKRQRILDWLKHRDEGGTRYDIAKMLGVNHETAERWLNNMIHDKLIFKTGQGKEAKYSLKRGNDFYNIGHVHRLFAQHFA